MIRNTTDLTGPLQYKNHNIDYFGNVILHSDCDLTGFGVVELPKLGSEVVCSIIQLSDCPLHVWLSYSIFLCCSLFFYS